MRTALDTNVLSAVLSGQTIAQATQRVLLAARAQGSLVLCGAAYAELFAHPTAGQATIDRLLDRTGIQTDFETGEDLWVATGTAYAQYAGRRRSSGGGTSRRLLADFVIGAHASLRADQLVTLDARHYRLAFPTLSILEPT